jgi:hypothetical protein
MWKKPRIPALLLLAAALLISCQDQKLTSPAATALPQPGQLARLLQPGQFEDPCGTPLTRALLNASGDPVGEVTVWNGATMAYTRLRAQEGWELTDVRVGGARRPEQFPRTGGVVDPRRFQFGGLVSPPQAEVVIEALHLGNPFNVMPGDEVLMAAFARLRPVGNGDAVDAWAEGTPFDPGQHPMYFRYTVQVCDPPPTITLDDVTVGSGLMVAIGGTLSPAAPEGGVTVRIESADPDKVLLSPNALTAGTPAIDIPLEAGVSVFNFWVHGVEGETGEVTLTGSADDFADGTATATVVETQLLFVGLPAIIGEAAPDQPFRMEVGVPTVPDPQVVRRGGGGLEVTVSSSNPGVARLVTSAGPGASVAIRIPEGANQSPATVGEGGVALDPLATGTTTISAEAPGALSASQHVTVTGVPPPPPPPGSCEGFLVSGTIASAGQVDTYTFSGTAGHFITVTLALTAGFPNVPQAPRATLIAPSNTVIDFFDARPGNQRNYTLEESGTYILRVNANDLVATGSYSLSVACIRPPSPDAVPIGYGDLVNGSLAAAQVDLYTFTGAANEFITVTLALTAGFPNVPQAPRVCLIAPSDSIVDCFDARPGNQRNYTLEESGTHVLRVNANNFVTSGSYALGLESIRPPSPDAVPIGYGDLVNGSLAAAQVDLYTFTGAANEFITVTLALTAGFPNVPQAPRVCLIAPSDSIVDCFDARPGNQRNYTLGESGTYVLRVNANNFAATGSYSVGLILISSAARAHESVQLAFSNRIVRDLAPAAWHWVGPAGIRPERNRRGNGRAAGEVVL